MSNLDEDIEILDDFVDFLKEEYSNADAYIKSLSNVLSELEEYQKHKKYHCEQLEKVLSEIESYKNRENKELETYKKIAEKLAERYIALENRLDETVEIDDDYCNFDSIQCFSFKEKSCYQCLLDWARKEVEK